MRPDANPADDSTLSWSVEGASSSSSSSSVLLGGEPMGDAEAARRAEEAAELEHTERARLRLDALAASGADDAEGWVVLRSAYAGGYVEVVSRGESDEYVVRIAADGKLSYRSLLRLTPDAIWAHSVGGYINWRRPAPNEPKTGHVRAHGNVEPWRALRVLSPSARLHVRRVPPVVDVLGALPCPTRAPAFDWNLLLDARALARVRGRRGLRFARRPRRCTAGGGACRWRRAWRRRRRKCWRRRRGRLRA